MVDFQRFDRRLQQMEQATAALESYAREIGVPTIWLHYEDLLRSESKTLLEVFQFLGVDPAETRSRCRKNTSDDLRSGIANFDELRGHYEETKYLPMFDEVLIPAVRDDQPEARG